MQIQQSLLKIKNAHWQGDRKKDIDSNITPDRNDKSSSDNRAHESPIGLLHFSSSAIIAREGDE